MNKLLKLNMWDIKCDVQAQAQESFDYNLCIYAEKCGVLF